jgi:hypothetical protein
MSNGKPTPGPWYVGADAAPDCPDHHNSGLALVDTGRSGDWPIARLCEWNNVNLIAAAPDLLEALAVFPQQGVNETDSHYVVRVNTWRDSFRAVAIEKSEGRQPQ